jgi:hypothetical protein
MVLRAGFKKKLRLYVELKIYDKNRRKITGPQCVKKYGQSIRTEEMESMEKVNFIKFKWSHPCCECIKNDDGYPSNTTILNIPYLLVFY